MFAIVCTYLPLVFVQNVCVYLRVRLRLGINLRWSCWDRNDIQTYNYSTSLQNPPQCIELKLLCSVMCVRACVRVCLLYVSVYLCICLCVLCNACMLWKPSNLLICWCAVWYFHSGLQPYILGKPLRYLILFIVVTGNI